MFGPFSYMAWSPLSFPLLIVMLTIIAVNHFQKNYKTSSAFRNRLLEVVIMMAGAYALRTTPLVSSVVNSIHNLETNVFSQLTLEFTPVVLIALFVWLSTTDRPRFAKHSKLWLGLLIVSVIGFAVTANYIALFLDTIEHIFMWLFNAINYGVNWFFGLQISHS